MRVQEIIEAHAEERSAQKEFAKLLVRRGMKQNHLAKALYGVDARGQARKSGHLSVQIRNLYRATDTTLCRWAEALDVGQAELFALREQAKLEFKGKVPVRGRPRIAPPAQIYEPPARVYNLAINADGTADLTMNLTGIPIADAVKVTMLLQELGSITRK